MKAWRRRGDRVVAALDEQESMLLRGLVAQVRDLLADRGAQAPEDELAALTGISSGPATAPEDPVLRRLLPDFYRLDEEGGPDAGQNADAAAAMRALHEPELLAAKTGVADVVLATCPVSGGRVVLDGEQAHAWLSAVNDVRLAMGTRLGVTEDMPEMLPDEDPRSGHLAIYHWLAWLQESLVQALLP